MVSLGIRQVHRMEVNGRKIKMSIWVRCCPGMEEYRRLRFLAFPSPTSPRARPCVCPCSGLLATSRCGFVPALLRWHLKHSPGLWWRRLW